MAILATRRIRLARKIGPPAGDAGAGRDPGGGPCRQAPATCRPRSAALPVTRGPRGDVRWWDRPAPGGHQDLWDAVRHLQRRRLQLGVSVADLARRLADRGHPIRRETLSRVLNGKQPTSWATIDVLADILVTDLPDGGPPSC